MTDQGISAPTVQNEVAPKSEEKKPKAAKSRKVLDGPTHLYKHYDRRSRLLYVGISLSALQRLIQHRVDAEWFNEIHMIVVEKFPTREKALREETKLIKKHKPPFNKAQKLGREAAAIVRRWGNYEAWSHYIETMMARWKKDGLYSKEVQDAVALQDFAARDAFIEAGLLSYPRDVISRR